MSRRGQAELSFTCLENAVLGEMMAQQVSGMGTYEQLGAIANSLPAF